MTRRKSATPAEKPARKPGRKPTDAEITKRIDQVAQLVLAGLKRSEIIRYIAEKTDWDVSERTVDNYLSRADALLSASSRRDRGAELGKAIARLEELYRKAVTAQDYKACVTIVRELANIQGLQQAPETGITPDDIRALMSALATVVAENVTDRDALQNIARGWAALRDSFISQHAAGLPPAGRALPSSTHANEEAEDTDD